MTAFQDLPHEIVAMILQAVDVWPDVKALARQLRTNRTFYTHLKPSLYANATEHLLDYRHPPNLKKFRETILRDPKVLDLVTSFTLPFSSEGVHYSDTFHEIHKWFTQTSACTHLELVIQGDFEQPKPGQAAKLCRVTDLSLSTWIPGFFDGEMEVTIESEEFEAWIKHMPRLRKLDISASDGLWISSLQYLPSTLARVELLGSGVGNHLSLPALGSILRGLPSLQHFLLSEIEAPPADVAAVLHTSLAPTTTSFGIGFAQRHDEEQDQIVLGRPLWEEGLATLLHKPYTSLTFYFVIWLVDFVDTLAGSESAKSISHVALESPMRPYALVQPHGVSAAIDIMYKLLDRSIFPNLTRITGCRIEEQMQRLKDWEGFSKRADEEGVSLARLEW